MDDGKGAFSGAPDLPIGTRRWSRSQNRRNSQNATAIAPATTENLTTRSATLVSAASTSQSMNHRPMSRVRSSSNITRDIGPGRAVHNCHRSGLPEPSLTGGLGRDKRPAQASMDVWSTPSIT